MTLVRIPTELTTAATDLLIAACAVAAIVYLQRSGPSGLRGLLWRTMFGFLAVAATLGAIAHGLVLDERTFAVTWYATYLALSLVVAAFFLASLRDLRGDTPARQATPIMLVVAFGFFSWFLIDPDDFRAFILYEAVAMLLALVFYLYIAARRRLPGAGWIAVSIIINLIAAGIQATGSIGFTLVWTFDHNGVFHLVQILGMAVLVYGLRLGDT
jgi:hypothetical protein